MIRIHDRERIAKMYHKAMAGYHGLIIDQLRLDVGEYGYHRDEQIKHQMQS